MNKNNSSNPKKLYAKEALAKMLEAIKPISETRLIKTENALGTILAEDIKAPINVPGFDNSAMDGYAINYQSLTNGKDNYFQIVGKSLAGHPFCQKIKFGEAVRIMTGAQIPENADVVIMQEYVELDGETIKITKEEVEKITIGQKIRPAGDDIKKGDVILNKGTKISPIELGLINSIGISEIQAYRKLKISIFSTGDELATPASNNQLGSGQIYDSNRVVLINLIKQMGFEVTDFGIIPDQAELIEQTLVKAAKNSDAVITSGGVSVGEADYISELLNKLGEINFWKVEIKPGRPMAFGSLNKINKNCIFFGLPGNPVSAIVVFLYFTRLGLWKFAGRNPLPQTQTYQAKLANQLSPITNNRRHFLRATIINENGNLTTSSLENQSSGVLRSLSKANGFIVLPEDYPGGNIGDQVDVQFFSDFLN